MGEMLSCRDSMACTASSQSPVADNQGGAQIDGPA
jgi:hypothetical protein